MRLGASSDTTRLEFVRDADLNYLEMALYEIAPMTDEEFEQLIVTLDKLGLHVEVVNGFTCSGMTVVGDDVDWDDWRAYCQRGLARAKRLGAEVCLFGSGKARNIPEGYDRQKGLDQIDNALRIIGDEAGKLGMTLVIEHLNYKETNTLNSLSEVIETVKRLNHPNIRAHVDFYHLTCVGESLEVVENSEGLIGHVHIARGADRKFPAPEDAGELRRWKAALDKCGYDGRVSLEAGPRVLADYPKEIRVARDVAIDIFK